MAADYTDVDIISDPLKSALDLPGRLSAWLAEVEAQGARDRALVVYFYGVKEKFKASAWDWEGLVVLPVAKYVLIISVRRG